MPLRFSLLMTVFDTPQFLPRALAGVRAQTHADWELLIVSDGPLDREPYSIERMLSGLRRQSPHQRIEFQELPRAEGCHGNVARNAALRFAAGDYVCWVNHDNLIFPNYLATHATNAEHTPGCVSVVDIDYWKDDRCHGRYPRALARSRIDLLNFAVPLKLALAVNAFGGEMAAVYAADWLTFDACRKRAPIEHSRILTGAHF